MRATIRIATLIALFVGLFASFNPVYADQQARSPEVHDLFIADYDSGVFTAAMSHLDGDSVKAIKFTATNIESFEDLFSGQITATLDLDDRGYTGMAHIYSKEYDRMIDVSYTEYTDDSHIVGYVETNHGITSGTLDGDQVQFRGPVVNGSIIKLHGADAYSTNGTGYLIQNGNLISYTINNGESAPVYTIYVAGIMR